MNIPLTRSQFALAISQGRGKALMHAKQFGIEDVTDLVLDTCLHTPPASSLASFDANWLFAFFKESPQYQSISDKFLNHVTKTGGIRTHDYFLRNQYCHIAALLAQKGNKRAEKILRDFVLYQPLGEHFDWCGVDQLHSLKNKEDAIFIAKRTGQSLQIYSEYQMLVDCYALRRLYGYDKSFHQTLLELAQNDEDIKIYLEELKNANEKEDYFWNPPCNEAWKQKIREQYSLEKILAMAQNCENSDWFRMIHNRPWSEHDLSFIAKCILSEKNDFILSRLMSILIFKPLPELDPAFFRFAYSSNPKVRSSSLYLLSSSLDERVGHFARERLGDTDYIKYNPEIFGIFNEHFKEGDEIKIISVLENIGATPERIYETHLCPEPDCSQSSTSGLERLLLWLYEYQPCPCARESLISMLCYPLKVFTKEMATECLYDAEESTREKAEDWLMEAENP